MDEGLYQWLGEQYNEDGTPKPGTPPGLEPFLQVTDKNNQKQAEFCQ